MNSEFETVTEIEELFEKYQKEYLNFDRIPIEERLHPQRFACLILKIISLLKTPNNLTVAADHDIIYLVHVLKINLTESDVIYLQRCGTHLDLENEYLAYFC